MTDWVVTVHMGTGSMAEGMVPQACFGPFASRQTARVFADAFYDLGSARSSTMRDEMLTVVTKINDVLDVETALEDTFDYWDWEEDD